MRKRLYGENKGEGAAEGAAEGPRDEVVLRPLS